MTGAEIITAVLNEGGFDVTRAQALEWINASYRRLVADAGYAVSEQTLATTVAGQAAYAIPAAAVDIQAVKVVQSDGSSPRYERVGEITMWDLGSGALSLSGVDGVFAPFFDSSGTAKISLYPIPDTTGLAITAIELSQPTDLTDGSGTPALPADFHHALVDGASSIGLQRLEERPDLAQIPEQRFLSEITRLRRRKNSRIGDGAWQIPVVGYHVN